MQPKQIIHYFFGIHNSTNTLHSNFTTNLNKPNLHPACIYSSKKRNNNGLIIIHFTKQKVYCFFTKLLTNKYCWLFLYEERVWGKSKFCQIWRSVFLKICSAWATNRNFGIRKPTGSSCRPCVCGKNTADTSTP